MLPNCKQVAEMLSEDLDQPISGFRRFKFKLHLVMCRYCRRYGEQLQLASETFERLVERQAEKFKGVDENLKNKLLVEFRAIHQNNQHGCKCDDDNKQSDADKS